MTYESVNNYVSLDQHWTEFVRTWGRIGREYRGWPSSPTDGSGW